MIAADTSAWIDFFGGRKTPACSKVARSLADGALVMPPPVLFELMSGPGLTDSAAQAILELPRLELLEGYWERAGKMRRSLLAKGLKARGMDCLIAQSCVDHGVALIGGDEDYRRFAKAGLKRA